MNFNCNYLLFKIKKIILIIEINIKISMADKTAKFILENKEEKKLFQIVFCLVQNSIVQTKLERFLQ